MTVFIVVTCQNKKLCIRNAFSSSTEFPHAIEKITPDCATQFCLIELFNRMREEFVLSGITRLGVFSSFIGQVSMETHTLSGSGL